MAWIRREVRSFRRGLEAAAKHAEIGRTLAHEMMAKATNAERRSDIATYMQLWVIEAEGRRTRATIRLAAMCTILVPTTLLMTFVIRMYSAFLPGLLIVSFYITLGLLVVSIIALLLSESKVRKMEAGWRSGLDDALRVKIDRHMAERVASTKKLT